MMGILRRSFARLFALWILSLFLGATVLAFLIDIIELLRATNNRPNIFFIDVITVSALRIPLIAEQLLPFAVLLGSMGAFFTLSRRSELVVARAAGLSVWQFIMPALMVAFVLGVAATTLYNPLATNARLLSERISTKAFGAVASILSDSSSEAWLRQRTPDGEAIMKVEGIADGGKMILEPTFWVFNAENRLSMRLEAVIGALEPQGWVFSEALVVDTSGVPRRFDTYRLPTLLNAEQVRNRLAAPESVSFWHLPPMISQAAASGLPPYRFRLQFHALLARPLLFASMVLIAATVSLGQARSSHLARMIPGGVLAGFVLYVVTEIARDLGSEGLVPAALAAWSPGLIASFLGVTILLYREDG